MSKTRPESTQGQIANRPRYAFSPGLPAALSFVVPGLGQAYSGKPFAGFLWLLTTVVGYVPFIIPGLVLHLLAITTACFRPVTDGAPATG